MKKIAQKIVAGALAVVLVATAVPAGPALTVQAATKNAAVKNQKQLVKALKTPSIKTVTINGGNTLKIPAGNYEKKTLVVDAGKVKVTNNGDFNKVNVKNATSFKENGSENTLKVTDNKLTLTVGKKADGTVVNVAKKGANLNLVNNGNLETITVSKAASLSVSGKSTNEVEIVNKASGSVIETAVASKLTLNKAADITVADGAKVSAIDAKAKSTISVESGASVETISAGGNADIKIAEGATVNEIGVIAKNSTVNVDVKGTLNSASVDAAASLNVTGSGAEEKPVAITANAEGASVKTEVPATITLNKNATVTVAEGAEGSSINANGEAKAEVTNSSKEAVSVTTTDASGNTTTSKPINPGANSTVSGTTGTDSGNDSGKDTTTTGGGSSSESYSGGGGYSVTTYPISYDLSELTELGLDTTSINLPSSYVAGRETSIQAPQYQTHYVEWERTNADGSEYVEDEDSRITYGTHIEIMPTTSGPLYFKAVPYEGEVRTITITKGNNINVSCDYYRTGTANKVQRAYPVSEDEKEEVYFWYPYGGTLPTVKVNNNAISVNDSNAITLEEYNIGEIGSSDDWQEYKLTLPATDNYEIEIGDVEIPTATLSFDSGNDANVIGFYDQSTGRTSPTTSVSSSQSGTVFRVAVKNGYSLANATKLINGQEANNCEYEEMVKPIDKDPIRIYKFTVSAINGPAVVKITGVSPMKVLTVTTDHESDNPIKLNLENNQEITVEQVAEKLLSKEEGYSFTVSAKDGDGNAVDGKVNTNCAITDITYTTSETEVGKEVEGCQTVLEVGTSYYFFLPLSVTEPDVYATDRAHAVVVVKVANRN